MTVVDPFEPGVGDEAHEDAPVDDRNRRAVASREDEVGCRGEHSRGRVLQPAMAISGKG